LKDSKGNESLDLFKSKSYDLPESLDFSSNQEGVALVAASGVVAAASALMSFVSKKDDENDPSTLPSELEDNKDEIRAQGGFSATSFQTGSSLKGTSPMPKKQIRNIMGTDSPKQGSFGGTSAEDISSRAGLGSTPSDSAPNKKAGGLFGGIMSGGNKKGNGAFGSKSLFGGSITSSDLGGGGMVKGKTAGSLGSDTGGLEGGTMMMKGRSTGGSSFGSSKTSFGGVGEMSKSLSAKKPLIGSSSIPGSVVGVGWIVIN